LCLCGKSWFSHGCGFVFIFFVLVLSDVLTRTGGGL